MDLLGIAMTDVARASKAPAYYLDERRNIGLKSNGMRRHRGLCLFFWQGGIHFGSPGVLDLPSARRVAPRSLADPTALGIADSIKQVNLIRPRKCVDARVTVRLNDYRNVNTRGRNPPRGLEAGW